jgi:hypothetical protein
VRALAQKGISRETDDGHDVMLFPHPTTGPEILVWASGDKMQAAKKALAELTGQDKIPLDKLGNQFIYQNTKVGLWQNSPLTLFNA